MFSREIEWSSPSLEDRIHNAIKDCIRKGVFPRVTYKDGWRHTSGHESDKPKGIQVHPVQQGFEPSGNLQCGGPLQARTGWIWEVKVQFDRTVNLGLFEEGLIRKPLRLNRTAEFDQQMDISLVDAVYSDPPEQGSATGSRVTYRFQVGLSQL